MTRERYTNFEGWGVCGSWLQLQAAAAIEADRTGKAVEVPDEDGTVMWVVSPGGFVKRAKRTKPVLAPSGMPYRRCFYCHQKGVAEDYCEWCRRPRAA